MRSAVAAVALLLVGGSCCASAQDLDDGADHAPAGDPQRAGALDSYRARPPWRVAGIDYPVGLPAGTILRSPDVVRMTGVKVDRAAKRIAVSASGVVLDRFDFAGWQVELLDGASDLTIERSRFLASPTQTLAPIYAARGGRVTLLFNTIDGGGESSTANPLFMAGTGGAVVAYNIFIHVPNDAINITQDGTFDIHNNLFDSLNYGDGHTDCVQTFFSALTALRVSYNTVYQPPPAPGSAFPGGGNSFVRVGDEQGHTVRGLDIGNNTLMFRGTETTRFANVFDISAGGGAVMGPRVHDNFMDPGGILYGIWSPYASELSVPAYADNRDLATGALLLAGPYNNQSVGLPPAPPAAPRIAGASRAGSVVVVTGTAPLQTTVSLVVETSDLAADRTAGDGTWTISATVPPSKRPIRARTTDRWGNASATVVVDVPDLGADGGGP